MHIKLFNLYRITGQLLPVYPVYLLLFQQRGLTISSISWLLIVWSLPGLLLEVPSSVLADRWNRRNLMVIGRLFKGSCFVVWSFSGSFAGFAAGFILWGIGGALCSGTEEAWLYDALKVYGRENEFDRIWGRSTFYYQGAVGIASVGGSILAAVSMEATLWLSVASVLVSTAFAAFLPEHNAYCRSEKSNTFDHYMVTLKEGIAFCWKNSKVSVLIGFSVTVLVTAGILDEYDQLIVRSMGVPLALVGTWGFLRYGLEAFGGKVAWRLKCIFEKLGLAKPVSIQITIAMIAGILLALVSGFPLLYLLPFYGLYYFLLSADRVLFTNTLQQEIRQQGRATVQSLVSMLESLFGILIYSLFGFSGKVGQLQGAMMVVAVWILVLCLFFWFLQRKRQYR